MQIKSSNGNNGVKSTAILLIKVGVLTFAVVILLRIFLIAFFAIPTSSMYPSLVPGDVVIVNKLVPGPRLDWIPAHNTVYRLKGYSGLQRSDILVFNPPYYQGSRIEKNTNTYYVKRCIGLPGDTLVMADGIYHIASATGTATLQPYRQKNAADAWMDTFKSDVFGALGWTLTNLGPVYIPAKGDSILLDAVNAAYYKRLVEYETGKTLSCRDGRYYLDDKSYPRHIFQQNYYFVAGDHSTDSEDSRYWGLLPEGHVVGKAAIVWKSVDPVSGKFRPGRFLKNLYKKS